VVSSVLGRSVADVCHVTAYTGVGLFLIKSIYCPEFFGTNIHLDTRISKMFPLAILNNAHPKRFDIPFDV
jgi:hypothetical protein